MLSSEKYGGWLEKEDDKLFKRDICCFDLRSNFLVLIFYYAQYWKGNKHRKSFKRDIIVLTIFQFFFFSTSFLVNIGKEMSLPGFLTKTVSP